MIASKHPPRLPGALAAALLLLVTAPGASAHSGHKYQGYQGGSVGAYAPHVPAPGYGPGRSAMPVVPLPGLPLFAPLHPYPVPPGRLLRPAPPLWVVPPVLVVPPRVVAPLPTRAHRYGHRYDPPGYHALPAHPNYPKLHDPQRGRHAYPAHRFPHR